MVHLSLGPITPVILVVGFSFGTGCTGSPSAASPPDPPVTVERVARVEIDPGVNRLAPGVKALLRAEALDALGLPVLGAGFQWHSSNPGVAAVGGNGTVTAFATGSAEISATTSGVSGKVTVQVLPPDLPPSLNGDTIFRDDFETGTLLAWEDGVSAALHSVVNDPASTGNQVLEILYPEGTDGGWLTHFFLPGYESIFVRYKVRLDPNWMGPTKLLALYGSRIDNRWSGLGKAGICPDGSDFFATMVITEDTAGDPPPLRFYTYYVGMAREPNGISCWGRYGDGSETYLPPLTLVPGHWHEIAFWVELNDPGVSNGRQRFWLDGVLRGEWQGLRFRDTDALRLNAVQISASVASGASRTQRIWVDDVLVLQGADMP